MAATALRDAGERVHKIHAAEALDGSGRQWAFCSICGLNARQVMRGLGRPCKGPARTPIARSTLEATRRMCMPGVIAGAQVRVRITRYHDI